MTAVIHPGPVEFLARAAGYLEATEFENNAMIGVANRAARLPTYYPQGIWCATVEREGRVVAAAVRTPPWPLLLSPMDGAALDDLAGVLSGRAIDAATGPEESVRGLAPRLGLACPPEPAMRLRFYVLQDRPTPPAAPGRMRSMTPDDRALALEWVERFEREAHVARPGLERANAVEFGIRADYAKRE